MKDQDDGLKKLLSAPIPDEGLEDHFLPHDGSLFSLHPTIRYTMTKLTAMMVIEMHDYLIETDGGEPGIRDMGTLEYLVDSINLEAELFRKAAWALYLADRHPFWDGQKRTAFQLSECDIEKIARWVRRKARRLEGGRQLHLG